MKIVALPLLLVLACGPKSKPVEGGGSTGGDPSPGGGSGSAVECPKEECGPRLGMPNHKCPDGTMAGPTDRCLRHADGKCGWEVIQCPAAGGGTAGACMKTGCSGSICADSEMMSTCEYRAEFDCYKTARCERQS